jgi:hypothetical protein
MRAWTMLAIGLTLLIGAMPGVAGAQATGEIGGPPTMGHLPFPPPHNKKIFIRARSEPIVIGVGFSAFGKVEIVGQDSDSGLCISIDHPKQDMTFESCGEVAVPPRAIAPDLLTWRTRRHRRKSLSELSGFMQPTVASVTAVAHQRKGRKRTRKAVSGTVAVPSPDLLAELHQSTSFGFFAADFRGCPENTKVRVHAFDAAGLLLGASRVNLGFPNRFNEAFQPCEPGSSGFAFFGTAPGRGGAAP